MLWGILFFVLLGDVMADPLAEAELRFRALNAYQVTVRSIAVDGERQVIRYFYRKPGWVRMEFIQPHKGAVSPDNPQVRSPRGHRVDRSDAGALRGNLLATGARARDTATTYVGRFDASASTPPPPWRVIRFDEKVPPTRYRVIAWDGVAAVEAEANASMALLARPLAVDLQLTPVLCWRWRVDAPLNNADMMTKQGDDYAARVYITFRLPPETLSPATRAKLELARSFYGDQVPDAALNYVWDNRYAVGTSRASAYTDRTRMIVQRSGPQQAGAWVSERRNVLADMAQAFGTERVQATLLAVAADTDNTGERARAGFADLHFVGREVACEFMDVTRGPE
ncbi:DUF3047 domain-containing protein [Pseudomonas sp. 2FG]|uniref:DUF3047 domain-containing protein n=1 Tax=Pseudomonas sp. 2FG TaxID=2502191 RepID=UPI001C498A3E|nr:DUF3047 domain-containing protein [Pseudomonas sp. 2FG]